jgi:hypothetical protein
LSAAAFNVAARAPLAMTKPLSNDAMSGVMSGSSAVADDKGLLAGNLMKLVLFVSQVF